MADTVDIKVSPDLISGIVETKIQTAITEALSEEKNIVEQVVAAALKCKVDSKGQRSNYSGDNRYQYIEWLCKTIIQKAAKEAVKRWAISQQAVLEKEFLQQLQTKKTSKLLVRACVDGLTEAVKYDWGFSIAIKKS